ncbi:MAG: ATP-binding cassette domain-containing protein [Gemmatimonadota bacterium]|nr:ATP-binding cassette domain-containing protein [Gemmatimonadota bacterium]
MTEPEPGAALQIDDVSKRYGDVAALARVTLNAAPGECLALVGESGSGKTTLLRCINRLLDPDSGTITIDGRDTRSVNPVTLRRSIGYVPQDGGILPHWSVSRNVALVPVLCGMTDAPERAARALETVGLGATIGPRWPHELSGGQRQRVAMARALAAGQRLLLLDEPFGALDAITRAELQRQLKRIRAATRPTTVLVTHDLREALFLADRIAVLRDGSAEQVADGPTLRAAPATEYVRRLLSHVEGEE